VAVADVYDALTSKRVYKAAFSHEAARGILIEGSGRHFDPAVVRGFLAVEEDFVGVQKAYAERVVEAA
jgi:HD-GYP domain-containing protein (c-di-GMP phosphodiesterase class II)